MRQARSHGVNDQDQQDYACAEKEVAKGAGDGFPAFPFVFNAQIVQKAALQQALIPAPPLMQQFGFGNAAGEDHGVHGEFFQPKMSVEEVNRKDETRRQKSFVGMNDERDVNHPARHEMGKELRKPHDQPRYSNGKNAPEHGKIIELFPISPPVELGFGTFAEKPFLVRDEIL